MTADPPTSFASGRYVVERPLGEGGRKDVYLARDTRLDRQVVVSWIKAAALEDGERERLQREVHALARLGGHAHVVTILDAGEEQGRPYLVTEFMSGESVALWLDRQPDRRLSTADALRVAGQLAEALAHAHKEEILHRDLKPANVWLDQAGTVKLGDFGLALFLDRPRVTTSGSVVGTPEYMPPEQALGQPLGPQSDLYALGAMLYEMLAGRPPFLADTPIAVVSQHLHAAPVAPSWHASGLPHEVDELVLRLLAKSMDERLPTAEAVGDAIHALEGRRLDTGAPDSGLKRNPLDRLARGLFVGRAEEMSKLRGSLEEAFAGRACLSLVAGEPGIGKTRLAQEICTYARLRGALTLFGRCYEGGAAPAFWPFAQVVRALIEEGGPEVAALAEGGASSVIAQILAEHPDESADTDGESASRFHLFDGIARFLAAASRHKPLQIVVDDLHWADGPSLALLPFLVRELDAARISLVVTYRDAEIEPRGRVAKCLAALRRASRASQLQLRGLIPTDIRALVESTEGRSIPSLVLDRIVGDTEGNPFFVEEMLRNLEEGRELDGESGASTSLGASLPEGVRDVIGHRLGRLPDQCQDVLVAAAAIGREFELPLLERVAGLGRGELLSLLDEAESARVVSEIPGVLGGWRFEHALMRETLFDHLRTVERIELHRRIGEALEELSADAVEPPLAELAHHFHEAALGGNADKAVDYALRAGQAATEGLAFEEAAAQFGRAFELSGYVSQPDPVSRCRHLLAQAEAHHRAGDREPAQEAFLRAAGMARSLREAHPEASAKALGRAAFGLGGIWGTVGVLEQPVVDLLAEAVSVQEGDSALHARLLARLSVAYYWSDQVQRRLDLSRAAREMAARLGDPGTRIYVLDAAHFASWGPDTLSERLALADEIIDIATEHGDSGATPGSGYFWRIIDKLEAGDIASVDRDIETYGQLADQWRQPHFYWYASVARAMRALLAGDLESGRRLAEESLALGETAQGENATHFFAVQQIEIFRLTGDLRPLVEPAIGFVRRYPAIPAWRAALAALHSSLGDEAGAREQLDRLAAQSFEDLPRDANLLLIGYFLAETVWILKDLERAELLYDMLVPYADHNIVVANAALCMGSVSHSLGRLAALLGRDAAATEHFTRAVAAQRSLGARPATARTQIAHADALLTTGPGDKVPERRERAHALLDAAFAIGDALSLPGINADAQGVLDKTGSRRSSAPSATDEAPDVSAVEGLFLREGEYWTIGWRGEVFRLKDALGLRYLSRLLAVPGEELHCADLFAGVGPSPSGNLPKAQPDLGIRAAMDEDAGEMLDPQAKEAYRARLRDLLEELAEAESFNDTGRLDRARTEMEALQSELARGVGLGGRDRKASSRKEQARLSVTRAIRSVLRKVEKASPELAEHLSATVKTGTFCSYTPDPRVPLSWSV